ncbi:NPCBM/NEW2 domain-containing protein [Amycolatopsis sp. NPDC021455]|uniref:PASTA domain-containing protein n=1 Tax=Amycolatopsis sp. NPDC021455 TaxID=3154901 RepID=UPI00340A6183
MIFTFTTEEPGSPFDRLSYDVAALLARWGYRVLYVDWRPSGEPGGVAALIADRLEPLDAARHVRLPGGRSVDVIVGGTADRLPSNLEEWACAYADGVADFIEDCAERWQAVYEVVVIRGGRPGDPSRAIAVAHLPDAVVLDCHGARAAALNAASTSRDLLPYGRAQLSVLPLHGNPEDYEQWTLPWVHATVRPEQVADLAAGDVRVLAALLANGLASTNLLVADPAAYIFAAEHRDGIMEAARVARSELAHLTPEHDDVDRILRELLIAHPTPIAGIRDVLVSAVHLGTWLVDLLADPEFRPMQARTSQSANAPVRNQCPVDGNYVQYRRGGESQPECPDHRVALESAPSPRRDEAAASCGATAARGQGRIMTGDAGTRPAPQLGQDDLDLLAAPLPELDPHGLAATAATSELQPVDEHLHAMFTAKLDQPRWMDALQAHLHRRRSHDGREAPGTETTSGIAAGSPRGPVTSVRPIGRTMPKHNVRDTRVALVFAVVLALLAGGWFVSRPTQNISAVSGSTAAPTTAGSASDSPTVTTRAKPSVMPNVVGKKLADAQDALPGIQPVIEDKIDATATDGTVIAQEPAAGAAIGGTVILTVARQAQLIYLDSVQPASGEWNSRIQNADIAGKNYLHALGNDVRRDTPPQGIEYNISKGFRRFTATAGIDDNAVDSSLKIQMEIFADGRRVFSKQVAYGAPTPIDLDVSGVLRLAFRYAGVSGSECCATSELVLATAELLGLPAEVPASPTTGG